MSQMIYAILAMALVMVLSLNMQRGVKQTTQGQTLNEAMTPLVGVGTEVLEHIGSTHFDGFNWNYENSRAASDKRGVAIPDPLKPYCGRVAVDEMLSLVSPKDPTGACTSYGTCNYIEGFNGLAAFPVQRGGFTYTVNSISVQFVDPVTQAASLAPTFAKKVTITVSNPYLYLGDDPTNTFSLTMSRVFTYGCVADPNLIPYVRAAPFPDVCPPNPCSRW